MKQLMLAAALLCAPVLADAATLSGNFTVTAVNVTNLTSAESEATKANFNAALADTLGGENSVSVSDVFTYIGDLDFRVMGPQKASYSIATWLGT